MDGQRTMHRRQTTGHGIGWPGAAPGVLKMNMLKFKGKYGKKLTLKVPITTAADDILNFFLLFFSENKTWHYM